jgi:hypothetical protein
MCALRGACCSLPEAARQRVGSSRRGPALTPDLRLTTPLPAPPGSTDLSGANFEFVAPARCYAVVNGERTEIDLEAVPPLTPRQLNVIAGGLDGLEAGISRCVGRGGVLSRGN